MKKNLLTSLVLLFASVLCAAEYTVDFNNKLRDSSLKNRGFMHRKGEILITEDGGNKCLSLGGEKRTAAWFGFGKTVEAGEISFRFKSLDWDCTSPNSHFLATFVSGQCRLMLYTQPNKRGHFLFNNQQTNYRAGGISGKFIWQKNQWHTIKVIWDAKTSTLYMDGKRISNINNAPEFKGWSGVSLGTYYLWKNSGTGTTLFDDFHFSDETVKKKSI